MGVELREGHGMITEGHESVALRVALFGTFFALNTIPASERCMQYNIVWIIKHVFGGSHVLHYLLSDGLPLVSHLLISRI
jgi:hypothetical protein